VVMGGVDVGVCGIDADAEQASGRDVSRCHPQMLVCLGAGAVLKDLDSHDDVVLREIR
jgi:hypothetical protein